MAPNLIPHHFTFFFCFLGALIYLPSANVYQGAYRYILDLLALEQCVPSPTISCPLGPTPIRVDRLARILSSHPDPCFSAFILRGFSKGFHLGFDKSCVQLRSAKSNHPSCLALPSVVQDQISAEVLAERLFGPLPPHLVPAVHISPMGLVPKSHSINKW